MPCCAACSHASAHMQVSCLGKMNVNMPNHASHHLMILCTTVRACPRHSRSTPINQFAQALASTTRAIRASVLCRPPNRQLVPQQARGPPGIRGRGWRTEFAQESWLDSIPSEGEQGAVKPPPALQRKGGSTGRSRSTRVKQWGHDDFHSLNNGRGRS